MKAFRILLKFVKYTLLTLLIIIVLASAGIYFFQDKIIELTFKEIGKHLATKIEIDQNVQMSILEKFPEISIKVKNVRIYESYPGSTEKLGTLKTLYFTFDAFDFIKGQYVLKNIYAQNGAFTLKINKNGKGNYLIIKTDTTKTSNVSFDLQKIVLENVDLRYINEPIRQDHDMHISKLTSSLKFSDQSWFIGLDGNLLVHQIGIGGNLYCKEKEIDIKTHQEYHEATQHFKITPSTIIIEGSEFNLSGYYAGLDKKEIDINLKAEKSTIAMLVSLLPGNLNKDLQSYQSSGNIFFDASIKGIISADQSPDVKINFGFNDASFFHPGAKKKIENATLIGSFNNGEGHDLSTSTLELKNITGVFDDRTFEGDFSLFNFNDPLLHVKFKGSVDLASFIKLIPPSKLKEASGILDLNLKFDGKISDLTGEGKENISAEGAIKMENINLTVENSTVDYKNINGAFSFDKNDLTVQQLSGAIGKSDFSINGSFKNFIAKTLTGKQKMMIDANIQASNIDVNELMSAFETTGKDTSLPQGKYPYLEDYQCKLNCNIGRLKFNKLDAKSISGEVEFNQPVALVKNFSFTMAGGKTKLNSIVNFKNKNNIEINTKGNFSNINVDSIFYIFDNFSQEFIRDKNLKGQLDGDVQLVFTMNDKLEIKEPTIVAFADVTIKNGELNNFEPMKKLSRFIEEKELENIRFSELKNKIYIESNKITIPEMTIKSNITTITVSGTHTFDQYMDYKLSIPIKDFKKKHPDKDEAFGAIEDDKKGNSLLFLSIKGPSDNFKIAYDKQRTANKIKDDLKKEGTEFKQIFKKKKQEETKEVVSPDEQQYFDDF